jgi:hypothetical protein
LKQFMILRMTAAATDEALTATPLVGTWPLPQAEEMLATLRKAEPGALFVIKEIGAA